MHGLVVALVLAVASGAGEPAGEPAAGRCVSADTASLSAVPYRSPADVASGLTCLERHFLARGDRRAIFASVYVVTTGAIIRHLEEGGFDDPGWAGRYLVAFGDLYRQAVHHDATGERRLVPPAWRVAFDSARRGAGSILGDAALGINAHVVRDLARALDATGLNDDRRRRYADHTAINGVLRSSTDEVLQRLGDNYSPAIADLPGEDDPLPSWLLGASWKLARQRAWDAAVRLTEAASATERAAAAAKIEAAALARACLLVATNTNRALLARLRELEGSGNGSTFCRSFRCGNAAGWLPRACPQLDGIASAY